MLSASPVLSEYFCWLLGTGSAWEGETVGGALAPPGCLDGRHFMSRYQTVLPAPNLFLKSHEVSVDRGTYRKDLKFFLDIQMFFGRRSDS